MKLYQKARDNWPIILILLIAFLMRIYKLSHQSLWLDELHNMNEADPDISWAAMFDYLRSSDQHPPLYFIVERLAFSIFGHTEFVARFISAIAGTVSVWAMWLLGREILNKSLGTIVAVITCVNFYNLFYSQEARVYIFAFLFATLSFVYFIRLIKIPGRNNALLHALFSLCLLYSHYYSLFVMVAQAFLALIFWYIEKGPEQKIIFRNFLLSFIIIGIGYAPWLPFLYSMSGIQSFWIGAISPDFMPEFYYDYFGSATLLKPFILFFLIVYLIRVSLGVDSVSLKAVRTNPLLLSFTICTVWVLITYLIPYIRSLLVVPMLFPRYTIVVVPAFLLVLAYGIELFRHPVLKIIITSFFVIFSLITIYINKFYSNDPRKSQFREMTKYVVTENTNNYPIINQVTSWQQQYYLKKFKSGAEVISGPKNDLIDSILTSPRWNLDGFWIVGAHGDGPPDTSRLRALANEYTLLKEQKFYDAWAQLFVSKSILDKNYRMITYNDFAPGEGSVLPAEEVIANWGGVIHSKPVTLQQGKYEITIAARGTAVKGAFPHVNVYVNDVKVTDYQVTGELKDNQFIYENPSEGQVIIKLDFDNDLTVEGEGDRNLFVRSIMIKKVAN